MLDSLGIQPVVVSINISRGGIPKLPVERIFVSVQGLEGDGHNHDKHKRLTQAVCLQDLEKLHELRKEGYPLASGETGENLTVSNLHVNALPLRSILEFSGGVILELTKIRQPCYVLDSIHPQLKQDIAGRCGIYAKVLKEGFLKKGESIKIIEPVLWGATINYFPSLIIRNPALQPEGNLV